MPTAAQESDTTTLERVTRQIGRDLFRHIGGGPSFWERAWWDDRLMGATMDDPDVKVQLFRFIDALPTLQSPSSVRRHLDEYLGEAEGKVPAVVSVPLAMAPGGEWGDRLLARVARSAAHRMAKRFIAGSTPDEAFRTVLGLRRKRLAFTADLLGEAVISESEAVAYQRTCLELLRGLSGRLDAEPEIPQIDRDDRGPIPRVNLSLKLTSLTPRFDPIDAEGTTDRVLERLRPILKTAREVGAFVNVDMEQYAFKDLTHAIFRQVLEEPEFRDWPHAGIVVQAYLREAPGDLESLRDWAGQRGTPITVRLVKGAYWDYEVLHARQVGWPVPVHTQKWQSDASYEGCADFLVRHHAQLRPAFGSHNIRSLAHAMAAAEAAGLPINAYEVQILHGMGDPIQRALVQRGQRVRVYTPYGAMLPGMAYLVRRLLENTSNESFLKASAGGSARVEDLLRDPQEIGSMKTAARPRPAAQVPAGDIPAFRNEPPTDFNREDNRRKMRDALALVRGRLGNKLPLLIGDEEIHTELLLESSNPSDSREVIGWTSRATAEHAARAVQVARDAFPAWSATSPRERADVLLRAAEIIRQRKFELAAWQILECGKPWREADGDLAEAIDFCEFYAREMLRHSSPRRRDVPGETNEMEHLARGVAVVIPPWNFPLAIPCGMTVAPLVAGCPVILKPAEQSPVIAWHLARILREAGAPSGAVQYLPGVGEEVGAALVADPRVSVVSFTGSRAVGLSINATAAQTPKGQAQVKRVIAEMGGKNAIIVDDDADLDEAVLGVLHSAFGYAGQKCSACSRAIVLDGVYDAFVHRLGEAAPSLPVGPADDPATEVPPVIDGEAHHRVLEYQQIASSEGRVVARVPVPAGLEGRGHYVGPLIVADVEPSARVAQEEIFGPVLAVLRARDLDHALEIANGTEYALTGGLYSRSPANIDRVRRDFLVGNLYINRACTGALVDRQPFGGFKLSGIGTKAGGPDYLMEFLLSKSITENTMRRGFSPDVDALADDEAESARRS